MYAVLFFTFSDSLIIVIISQFQEKYQQIVCKTAQHESTSTTGGWCTNAFKSLHLTDAKFSVALETVLAKKSIIGLGDGPGSYRSHLLAKKVVEKYDAYDGSPFIYQDTNSQVCKPFTAYPTHAP